MALLIKLQTLKTIFSLYYFYANVFEFDMITSLC